MVTQTQLLSACATLGPVSKNAFSLRCPAARRPGDPAALLNPSRTRAEGSSLAARVRAVVTDGDHGDHGQWPRAVMGAKKNARTHALARAPQQLHTSTPPHLHGRARTHIHTHAFAYTRRHRPYFALHTKTNARTRARVTGGSLRSRPSRAVGTGRPAHEPRLLEPQPPRPHEDSRRAACRVPPVYSASAGAGRRSGVGRAQKGFVLQSFISRVRGRESLVLRAIYGWTRTGRWHSRPIGPRRPEPAVSTPGRPAAGGWSRWADIHGTEKPRRSRRLKGAKDRAWRAWRSIAGSRASRGAGWGCAGFWRCSEENRREQKEDLGRRDCGSNECLREIGDFA